MAVGIRRIETQHGTRRQPFLIDQSVQHGGGVVEQRCCRLTDDCVIKNLRILAVKLPGIKERHPVDVVAQNTQIDVIENTVTE